MAKTWEEVDFGMWLGESYNIHQKPPYDVGQGKNKNTIWEQPNAKNEYRNAIMWTTLLKHLISLGIHLLLTDVDLVLHLEHVEHLPVRQLPPS